MGERPMIMRVLAIGSAKGGVSKTTSTLYLATRAAEALGSTPEKPLVGMIDRDDSRNLTRLLHLRPELLRPGVVLLPDADLPSPASGLEFVIIDTPPGFMALPSLKEAHMVLVPVLPEDQGVANLILYLERIEDLKKAISPAMRLIALLPAMVDRTSLHRERLQEIREIAAHQRPPLRVLSPVPRRARIAAFDLGAPEYDDPAKELFSYAKILARTTATAS
jgi:cellulose biosynthesis protein BcsQ